MLDGKQWGVILFYSYTKIYMNGVNIAINGWNTLSQSRSHPFCGVKLFYGILYRIVGIYLTVIANGSMNGG